jgi:MFS family permease
LSESFKKDWQYYKFCVYGFLKNQRFFEPFLLLIFLRDKGLSFTEIGTLYSIRFILRSLLEIPSGVVADALGRKGTMLFSYAFYMISFAVYFLADSFSFLIVPTICFAVGDAFRTGTHKAMIFEYLKRNGWQDQKVDYYGHTRSWSQTGSAISSLIAAVLVLAFNDYNIIFLFSLLPYTLGFILLASYPSWLNGTAKQGSKYFIAELIAVTRSSLASFSRISNIRLTLNISSFSGYYNAAKDYLQILLIPAVLSISLFHDLNPDNTENETVLIGVIYFVLYFLTALAARSSGKVHRYFSSNARFLNIFLLLGLAFAIGAGMMNQLQVHTLAIILFIGILCIENLRRPAGIATMADSFDDKILASVLSIESQLSSILGAALSMIIGFLADRIGAGYALVAASGILLISYPLIRLRR